MAERLRVRFLTVIWGARYVQEFARVSVPSYLTPGNLPFVASETDLEILIMTSKDSQSTFEEEPAFARLRELCPVRYILIDDLITTGVYGVTLTLAYARGIRDSGERQTDTHFIFMNSDFILAEGSLRTLIGKFQEGDRCIMAPSLRANSEAVLPKLAELVAEDGTLSMQPREMVRLAFDNLHPTVVAKTVTQEFITCHTHNQIYWQVDDSTLLARHHLIFMLGIKPEVPMEPANSYCDYGFVPELVPSGQFTVLDDSDAFFMLELQPSQQEANLLACGKWDQAKIAGGLSVWTTREHRRFAEIDIIFHSSDLPGTVDAARARFAAFITELHRSLRQPPVDHVDHYYWVSGVQAWLSLRSADGLEAPPLPPELAMTQRKGNWLLRGIHRLIDRGRKSGATEGDGAQRILGAPLWHYRWLDALLVQRWVSMIGRQSPGRNLLICDRTSSLRQSLPQLVPCDVLVGVDRLAIGRAEWPTCSDIGDGRYDNLILHVHRARVRQTRKVIEYAETHVKPDGTIAIYIDHPNGELEGGDFSSELPQYVDEVLPTSWLGQHLEAVFAGGRRKRRLRRAERLLARYFRPISTRKVPHMLAAFALWPGVAMLTALNNYRSRHLSSTCPPCCSSALLVLTQLRRATRPDAPRQTDSGAGTGVATPPLGSVRDPVPLASGGG
jgi:hypothetical protein